MTHHLRWDAGTHGNGPIHLQPDGNHHTVTITQPDGTPILGLIRHPDSTVTTGTWPDDEQWQPLTANSEIATAIRLLVDEFWDQEKADYNEQKEEHRGYHPFDALTELKTWLDKLSATRKDAT
jgi:hypothetical protein